MRFHQKKERRETKRPSTYFTDEDERCPYCYKSLNPKSYFKHIEQCFDQFETNEIPFVENGDDIELPINVEMKDEVLEEDVKFDTEHLEHWLDSAKVKEPKPKRAKNGPKRPKKRKVEKISQKCVCDHCFETFESTSALKAHKKENHKDHKILVDADGKFKCDHCDSSFITKFELRRHRRRVHNPKNKCDLCERQFSNPNEVEKHKRGQHFGELTYTCNYCDFRGASGSDINAHKKKVHPEVFKSEIVCHLCGNSYKSHYFNTHMENVHLGAVKKQVMCDLCGTTVTASHLRNHIRQKHFRFLICTICDNVFKSRLALVKHFQEKHQVFCNRNTIYVCFKCKTKFGSSKELSNHLRSEHDLPNEHACSKCESMFPTKTMVTVHLLECHEHNPFKDSGLLTDKMRVIREDLTKPFQCNICSKRFKHQRTLNIHYKQSHDTSNRIHCEQCDFTAYAEYVLRKHVLERHAAKTLYPCDKCSFVSNSKASLTKHLSVHGIVIKNKHCPECKESFETKRMLGEHMLTEHNIVYKYQT